MWYQDDTNNSKNELVTCSKCLKSLTKEANKMNDQHLYNEEACKLNLELNYIDLAKMIVQQNYGTVKMLEAIIIARQTSDKFTSSSQPDLLVIALEDMLKKGLY